jgi:hypothetical protein
MGIGYLRTIFSVCICRSMADGQRCGELRRVEHRASSGGWHLIFVNAPNSIIAKLFSCRTASKHEESTTMNLCKDETLRNFFLQFSTIDLTLFRTL